jgi:hypothetical protein
VVVVGLIVLLAAGLQVRDRVERDEARQPLEAAERAAVGAGKPIEVLSASQTTRWMREGPGPAEDEVAGRSGPGNVYLEPAFYYLFGHHGGPAADAPPTGSRCYFFPVQRGVRFDAARVSAVMRLCYLDGEAAPDRAWTASD